MLSHAEWSNYYITQQLGNSNNSQLKCQRQLGSEANQVWYKPIPAPQREVVNHTHCMCSNKNANCVCENKLEKTRYRKKLNEKKSMVKMHWNTPAANRRQFSTAYTII